MKGFALARPRFETEAKGNSEIAYSRAFQYYTNPDNNSNNNNNN